ncbi:fructose-bisphosphate aldolase [Candidatus Riesia pthiripubis]|uniref:Fructose-bisphosphate aldolase n=1 Tax=Candidatus Riesia pthiripubis TaxID=428412 RepID=A0A1V0HP72_9ENTR|nr:fructose-bisphosphate aldolase [Candidatus Riesia pthiripubis]
MSKCLDFIKPGVISGNNLIKLFSYAREKNFAIPAINCINTDLINIVLESAYLNSSPVIIQFSSSGSSFFIGKEKCPFNSKNSVIGSVLGAYYVHKISKYYGVPVILHTDHCCRKLLPWIDGLILESKKFFKKNGKPLFSSHMIDLSKEDIKYNVKTCSLYLKEISKINAVLEIELGCTGGEEDIIDNSKISNSFLYTNPEDVCFAYENLIKISKNFTIAASFGNIHGVHGGNKIELKPEILMKSQKHIKNKFDLKFKNNVNFVFHGGSGCKKSKIQESIDYGVVKVNFDTDIQWANWKGILDFYKKNKIFLKTQFGNSKSRIKSNKKYYDPRSWIRNGKNYIARKLDSIFEMLNCKNKL